MAVTDIVNNVISTASNVVAKVTPVVTTVIQKATPVVGFIGKHWKTILSGLVVIYAVIISVLYFNLNNMYNSALTRAKSDGDSASATIVGLTTNFATAEKQLAESIKTIGQQQDIIRSANADNSRLANLNSQLAKQNQLIIANSTGLNQSNTDATNANESAIKIVTDLINASK